MEQKILNFCKNATTVFAEADRAAGAVHIEKLGRLESWDLFQQLVLYSDVEPLCDRQHQERVPLPCVGTRNIGYGGADIFGITVMSRKAVRFIVIYMN